MSLVCELLKSAFWKEVAGSSPGRGKATAMALAMTDRLGALHGGQVSLNDYHNIKFCWKFYLHRSAMYNMKNVEL